MITIVYLDDEPDICQMFEDNFASQDVSVTTFHDVERAIHHIQNSKVDLVFLDYRLPGMTGAEVAQRLPADLPKALITGDLNIEEDGPFVKIFHKPLEFRTVEKFIKSFVGQG